MDADEAKNIDAIKEMVEADSGRVEIVGDAIIVTLPGTCLTVTYRKSAGEPRLVASNIVRDPDMTLARHTEFLATAWCLANDKARELGWVV